LNLGKLTSSEIVDAEILKKRLCGKLVLSVEPDLAIKWYLKKAGDLEEAEKALVNARIVVFFEKDALCVAICRDGIWNIRKYELGASGYEFFAYSKPRGGDPVLFKILVEGSL